MKQTILYLFLRQQFGSAIGVSKHQHICGAMMATAAFTQPQHFAQLLTVPRQYLDYFTNSQVTYQTFLISDRD